MAPRGSSWRPEEVTHLLTIVEEVVPLSPNDWKKVKELHDEQYSQKKCTVLALTHEFQQLHRTTEPTGDPNLPHEVEWALNIKEVMREKADGTTGSVRDDERFEDEDEDDEEEKEGEEDNVFIGTIGSILEEEGGELDPTQPHPPARGGSENHTRAANSTPLPASLSTTVIPAAATAAPPRCSPPTTTQRFNNQLQGMRG